MGAHTKERNRVGEHFDTLAGGGGGKIVQLLSKHNFSFFIKRFHGVANVLAAQLTTTNDSSPLVQSAGLVKCFLLNFIVG
jgi:hypothetical protein